MGVILVKSRSYLLRFISSFRVSHGDRSDIAKVIMTSYNSVSTITGAILDLDRRAELTRSSSTIFLPYSPLFAGTGLCRDRLWTNCKLETCLVIWWSLVRPRTLISQAFLQAPQTVNLFRRTGTFLSWQWVNVCICPMVKLLLDLVQQDTNLCAVKGFHDLTNFTAGRLLWTLFGWRSETLFFDHDISRFNFFIRVHCSIRSHLLE